MTWSSRSRALSKSEACTHAPTGALFVMGESDVVSCEMGLAGTNLGGGRDYDVEEVRQAAYEVFKLQQSKCV